MAKEEEELDFSSPMKALTKFLGTDLEESPDINTEFPTKESIRNQISLRLLDEGTELEVFKQEADITSSVMKSKGRKSREEVVNAIRGMIVQEDDAFYRSFGEELDE